MYILESSVSEKDSNLRPTRCDAYQQWPFPISLTTCSTTELPDYSYDHLERFTLLSKIHIFKERCRKDYKTNDTIFQY